MNFNGKILTRQSLIYTTYTTIFYVIMLIFSTLPPLSIYIVSTSTFYIIAIFSSCCS